MNYGFIESLFNGFLFFDFGSFGLDFVLFALFGILGLIVGVAVVKFGISLFF